MRQRSPELPARSLLSLMMAFGLLLPMLGMLGLLSFGWQGAAVSLAVTLLLTAGSLLGGTSRPRRTAVGLAGTAVLIALLLYAYRSGLFAEVFRGMTLHAAGLSLAMPLIGARVVPLLAVTVSLLSWPLTARGSGGFPALLVLVLAMLGLWMADCGHLLLMLAPAIAAALSTLALARNEEVRARRVLPAMLALSLALTALVPAGGMTVPPLKEAADRLRQRILDYFFFTEPRNVFTLAEDGYYPMGNGQLGGPAEPSDRPVMAVYTPRTVYLRGRICNDYTGLVWQDTTGGSRYLWVSPRWRSTRDALLDSDLPAGKLRDSSLLASETITVRMVGDSQSSLFVPQRLRSLSVTGSMVPYFNNASEVFITRDLESGDTWTVTASLTTAGAPGLDALLAACEQSASPGVYDQFCREYTTLPGHLQYHVYDIAHQATAGASTPYEKALALQNWLMQHCTYTLNVPDQPEGVDFVSYFLLNSRKGYCTYFASAMTVLARMAGLPARYVEGYLAQPGTDGIARVTGRDGHAWTEIYFAGYGWLTFDATPPQSHSAPQPGASDASGNADGNAPTPPPAGPDVTPTPQPEDPEEIPTPSNDPQPSPPPDNQETPLPMDDPDSGDSGIASTPPSAWPWLLLLLLALIAGAAWRILQTMPGRLAAHSRDEYAAWLVWMTALTEALAAHGHRRTPSESLGAFLHRVTGQFPGLSLDVIGDCSAEVLYGDAMPNPQDVAQLATACAALEKCLPLSRRVRLVLRRAVTPASKRSLTRA